VCALLGLAACGSAVADEPAQLAASRTNSSSPSTSTTTATSTTTTSTTVAPPARALHKVMLLGDSEMFDAAPFITDAFRAAGIEVNSQAFPGTSILGGTSVTKTFSTVVAEQDPDAVILLYSGVYLGPYPKTADGQDVAIESPEFWKEWRASAAQATRDLSVNGARVYWVLLPHNTATWASHNTGLTDAYLALQSLPNVGYVDWRRTLVSTPDGAPLAMAPIGPDGALVTVRGEDGRHFDDDASRYLAGVAVSQVLRDYGLG
jgi:hypothetical protein